MPETAPEPRWKASYRRLRARQIAFLHSTPDPDSPLTTEEEMHVLFLGLPEREAED